MVESRIKFDVWLKFSVSNDHILQLADKWLVQRDPTRWKREVLLGLDKSSP